MYEREVCENCGSDITYGHVYNAPGLGNVCEECFLDWAKDELSDESWEDMYQGSAEKLADLMDIDHDDISRFLDNKRSLIKETKWENYNDR